MLARLHCVGLRGCTERKSVAAAALIQIEPLPVADRVLTIVFKISIV